MIDATKWESANVLTTSRLHWIIQGLAYVPSLAFTPTDYTAINYDNTQGQKNYKSKTFKRRGVNPEINERMKKKTRLNTTGFCDTEFGGIWVFRSLCYDVNVMFGNLMFCNVQDQNSFQSG